MNNETKAPSERVQMDANALLEDQRISRKDLCLMAAQALAENGRIFDRLYRANEQIDFLKSEIRRIEREHLGFW